MSVLKHFDIKDLKTAKNQITLWADGLFVASGLIRHCFK